jgi:hypothetical protein
MPIVGPLEEFGVRRHVVTVAILSIALVVYETGSSGPGIAALAAGAAFELWFWVRLIGRRPPASDPDAQPAK